MSSNPKASKAQKIKDTLKFPFKALAGVTNVVKTSTYTALDGADVIISSIQNDGDGDSEDEIQTIPSSVLRYTQGGTVMKDEAKQINVLEKVGNVTLTTRQTLKAVNPINVIGNGLKGVQSVVNVVYDMQDAMEEAELRKEQARLLGIIDCFFT